MGDDDAYIDETISVPRLTVHDALASAGREDLFRWADENRLSEPVAELLVQLSLGEGAEVEDRSGPQAVSITEARALIPGTRIHIHLRKAGWALVTAALPAILALIRIILGDHSSHPDLVV